MDKRSFGRQNKTVLLSFTPQELDLYWSQHKKSYQEKSNKDEPVPFSPCWIWTGSTQNGYPSVSQGHGKSKIKIHMLAVWTKLKAFPQSSEVVSHLCHRKMCINPDHLTIESISCNNARKGCLHSLIDSNGKIWNLCWHKIPCIRRDTDIVQDFKPHII